MRIKIIITKATKVFINSSRPIFSKIKNSKNYLKPGETPPPELLRRLRENKPENKKGSVNGIDYKYIGKGTEATVYKIGHFPNATALKIYHADEKTINARQEAGNFCKLAKAQATKDVVEIYKASPRNGYLHREYISPNKKNSPEKEQDIATRTGKKTLTEAGIRFSDNSASNRVQGILIDLGGLLYL